MARSARQDAAGASADEVTAHDLAVVVQALTGRPAGATDMDEAERHEDQHDRRGADPSTRSTPPNERRRHKS